MRWLYFLKVSCGLSWFSLLIWKGGGERREGGMGLWGGWGYCKDMEEVVI